MTNSKKLNRDDSLTVKEKGHAVVRIGLLVTLYFRGAHENDVRQNIMTLLADYLRQCGDRLRWTTIPPKFTWARVKGNLLTEFRERLFSTPADASWEFIAHGGAVHDEASDYRVEALGLAEWKDRIEHLSYFTALFPIEFFTDNQEDSFVATVARWVREVKPIHGYGGLAIIESLANATRERHEQTVYSIAQQFPGLEVDYPTVHSMNCAKGIKGINWLTILSEPFVAQLGGISTLQTHFGDQFTIYPYSGGVIIQAGPQPQMGSGNECPDLYIKLNTILRPIRASNGHPFHHYGTNRFDLDRSNEWLQRFDR